MMKFNHTPSKFYHILNELKIVFEYRAVMQDVWYDELFVFNR